MRALTHSLTHSAWPRSLPLSFPSSYVPTDDGRRAAFLHPVHTTYAPHSIVRPALEMFLTFQRRRRRRRRASSCLAGGAHTRTRTYSRQLFSPPPPPSSSSFVENGRTDGRTDGRGPWKEAHEARTHASLAPTTSTPLLFRSKSGASERALPRRTDGRTSECASQQL